MQCEDVRNELAGRVIDDLDEPVRGRVRGHLDGCATCREEAVAFEETWLALERLPGEAVNATAMRDRFNAALDIYRDGLSHAPVPRRGTRATTWLTRWWPREPALQAGLAVLFLGAGLVAGWQAGSAREAPDSALAELRRELHDTRQMVMLSLLQQQSAAERLRGVSWSGQIEQPAAEVVAALIESLMHDSNVNVRLACVEALRRYSEQPAVRAAAVRALSEPASPLVQIALIDFVVETRQLDAADALRRLSDDPAQDQAVRARASWGLQQLG